MRARSVCGLIPRSARGALVALDAAARRGQRLARCGGASRVELSGPEAASAAASAVGAARGPPASARARRAPPERRATSRRLPSPRIAARSITAASSRTLPGHAYVEPRDVVRVGDERDAVQALARALGEVARERADVLHGARAAAAAGSGRR
jgi:hypothetical protein